MPLAATWSELKQLTPSQRNTVIASYLGWTLDAFDFFILVFVLKYIAEEFGTDVKSVALAITLTLAARPVGALMFGVLADRYGRRPVLMADIVLYSILEFASGFAPSLMTLLILRTLFGIAMGGEWGVGASLTMETIPPKTRGVISGLLQAGYPSGYLIASVVFGLLFPLIGWRGMFMVGAAPALLVLFVRRKCRGIAGLRRPPDPPGPRRFPGGRAATCGRLVYAVLPDDGLQLLQPWHPGSLPDLPADPAQVFDRDRQQPSPSSTISVRSSAALASA